MVNVMVTMVAMTEMMVMIAMVMMTAMKLARMGVWEGLAEMTTASLMLDLSVRMEV